MLCVLYWHSLRAKSIWACKINYIGLDFTLWTVLSVILYHPLNMYTIKVQLAWERPSFKNVDLVFIQSSDPQARIFNRPIFGKLWYFPPKSSEGCKKLKHNDKTLIFLSMITNESLLVAKYFLSWSKIPIKYFSKF